MHHAALQTVFVCAFFQTVLNLAHFLYIHSSCAEQGEGLQVLQYKVGEKYEPHYDYFHDIFNTKNGGQRIATVLMYL